MKRMWISALFVGAVLFQSPADVQADPPSLSKAREQVQDMHRRLRNQPRERRQGRDWHRDPRHGHDAVPELDPNAAGGALALLLGGTLLTWDRRRRYAGR